MADRQTCNQFFFAQAQSPWNTGQTRSPPELPGRSKVTTTYFLCVDHLDCLDLGTSLKLLHFYQDTSSLTGNQANHRTNMFLPYESNPRNESDYECICIVSNGKTCSVPLNILSSVFRPSTTSTMPLTTQILRASTKWFATSQKINRNMQNIIFIHLFVFFIM